MAKKKDHPHKTNTAQHSQAHAWTETQSRRRKKKGCIRTEHSSNMEMLPLY